MCVYMRVSKRLALQVSKEERLVAIKLTTGLRKGTGAVETTNEVSPPSRLPLNVREASGIFFTRKAAF